MADSSPKDKEFYTFDFALKVLTAVSAYLAAFTYLLNLIPQRDNPYLSRILYDERVAEFNTVYVFLLLLDCLVFSYAVYTINKFS